MSLFYWILALLPLVLWFVAAWVIYEKAGEAGWKCLIPIYSTLVLLKIVGRDWWWILLLLIPIVNVVVWIIVIIDLAKSFGHGVGFAIGLLLLPFIFGLILAFSADTYKGPAGRGGAATV